MTRNILAIDPGPSSSGAVLMDATDWPPTVTRSDRDASLDELREWWIPFADHIVCEWLTSYGAAVGATVLDTAMVVGRIKESAFRLGRGVALLTRPEVGLELAGSRHPKTAQVSEAIRDIYRRAGRATGGGKDPVIGTKNQPGPLYGVALSQHEGSALAVGLAWLRMERDR